MPPILFAFGEPISAVAARARACARPRREIKLTTIPMLLPVSVYGGYFGAGVGVLLIAVLSIATGGEYRPANVTKNLVAAPERIGGDHGVRRARAAVNWPAALSMMCGA